MDDTLILELFERVAGDSAGEMQWEKRVFSLLVKTTVAYRDHLLESHGIVLTVEDVRTALDSLVPVLTSGILPKKLKKIHNDLLMLWLEDLKGMGGPEG